MSQPIDDPTKDTAQPKKRELPTKKNTSVRNLVWAIGLNLILVAIAAAVITGLGRNDRNHAEQSTASINVSESAARASDSLGFTAAAPEPQGFTARTARLEPSEPKRWIARYTARDGSMMTLVQSAVDFPAIAATLNGNVSAGEGLTLHGARCSRFTINLKKESDRDAEPVPGLECSLSDSNLVIYGGTTEGEADVLMNAALETTTSQAERQAQ